MTLRSRLYELLEDEEASSPGQRRMHWAMMLLIGASVVFACIDTVASIHAVWGDWLHYIERGFVVLFTIEYLTRIWVVVEDRAERYRDPVRGRLRYAATPLAIVDLLAVAPFYLSLVLPIDPIILRSLRLLRVLKIARFSPALSTIEVVVINERRALLSTLLLFVVALLLSSAMMFAAERHVQPDAFASIPAAMWWSISTLTTVGYGDVVPATPAGKAVAGFTALIGIAMLALPTAILGAGFVNELRKRDFGLAAAMIARVPVFRHLAPAQLAELAALLHPRSLPPRYILMRRGEHPDAMYFIDEGEVQIRSAQRRLVLGPGEYFGELALLEGAERRATITTLTGCRLLELRANDFMRLVAGDPALRETLLDEARRRYGLEPEHRPEPGVAALSE